MEYSVNSNKKVIHAQFKGPVNSDNLIHHILEIRSDRYFQDGYNLIANFQDAEVPKGYMELARVAEFVKVTSVVRTTFRLAILVADVDQIRSASLYILLSGQKHIQIFQSLETAKDWVTQDGPQQDEQRVEENEI